MRLFIAVVILVCSFTSTLSAHPIADYYEALIPAAAAEVESRAQIVLNEGVTSSPAVDNYLASVLWLSYCAVSVSTFRNDSIPVSMNELVLAGILSSPPLNPLADWEPITILGLGDGFSPGELFLQICPPTEYSLVGTPENYQLVPLSFELGIYGASVSSPGLGDLPPPNEWAQVPAGTFAMLGAYSENAATTLAKWEELEEEE